MSLSHVATTVLSSLGNNTGSVIPIATKDLIQNQVLVAQYHKEGGKYDAFEKFVEENGTSAIWLGGLPLIKKIMDKTLYKAFKMSPDVDIRKLKDGAPDSISFAMEKLKEQGKTAGEQYKALEKVAKNKNLAKGLFATKFAVATGATMLALGGIILFKQKSTEEKVKNKIEHEMAQQYALRNSVEASAVGQLFKSKINNNENKNLSFKGLLSNAASAFMYNPVLNQFLLDIGITGLRGTTAREGERKGVLTKEAFEIAFLYPLAAPIQKGFDFAFGKLFNKNTRLDYSVLASDRFEKSLADNSMKNALTKFNKKFDIEKIGKDADIDKKLLNFIYDNPDNPVVKFLKDTGDVATVSEITGKKFGLFNIKKATDEIDSLSFINTKAVGKNIKKLSKTVESMDAKGALGNADKVKSYLKGAKAAKGLSIISAIAFGIWAMGVLQTKVVLAMRKNDTGSTENQAITKLEHKIKHQMAFEGNNAGKFNTK